MQKFKEKEGATELAKEYKHAYVRSGKVWVKGTIKGFGYQRVSTKKDETKANLNWAEKNWEYVITSHLQEKESEKLSENTPTLQEYAELSFEANSGNRRIHTTTSYRNMFKKHISKEFGNRKVDDIKPIDLKKWQSSLISKGLKYKTLMNIRAVFMSIFKDAEENELIKKNPFDKVKAFKKNSTNSNYEVNPFNMEEIFELIDNASHKSFKNMLKVLFFTGIRPGEMLALEWSNIDFRNRVIKIRHSIQKDIGDIGPTKTESSMRDIDMLDSVEEALKEQYLDTGYKSSGFIFLTQYDERYKDTHSIRDSFWKPLLKQLLFNQRDFYNTRHTFASIMLSNGEDPLWISQMLGHKDLTTTFKYYAKYIKQDNIERATFLNDYRTKNVQKQKMIS